MLTEVAAGLKQPAKAFALEGFVIQSQEILPDGVRVLITTCVDYDDFKKLPNVVRLLKSSSSIVSCENSLYGKTGWNSDRHIAYYRDDAKIALAV